MAPWTTLDLILNYTSNLPPPTPAEVPGFTKDGGKNVLMKRREGETSHTALNS
jgi:hypothetical protein